MEGERSIDMENIMKRKNTAEAAVSKLYEALEMPFTSGYLSKTALSKVAQEIGLPIRKGDYVTLAIRCLRQLNVPYTSADIHNGRLNGRTTQAMIEAFFRWKEEKKRKEEEKVKRKEENVPVTYKNCSRLTLKKSITTLLGSEYATSMGTRSGDFLLNSSVLRAMADAMGLGISNAHTNRQILVKLLKELGEKSSDVPVGGRAPVGINERLAIAFLENADAFIEGASESLSKVKLEPRYIHPDQKEKKVEKEEEEVVIPKQEEKVEQPTVEDEGFTVELGDINLLNIMKGGRMASLNKAFKSCSEIGEVTKCDLAEGGRKIIIEIDLGGE